MRVFAGCRITRHAFCKISTKMFRSVFCFLFSFVFWLFDSTSHCTKDCKFEGKCANCGKIGHKEVSCRFRNRTEHKPRAHYAQADGHSMYANMISVQETKTPTTKQSSLQALSSVSYQPPGTVWEESDPYLAPQWEISCEFLLCFSTNQNSMHREYNAIGGGGLYETLHT